MEEFVDKIIHYTINYSTCPSIFKGCTNKSLVKMFIVDESVQFICGGEGSDIYISIYR